MRSKNIEGADAGQNVEYCEESPKLPVLVLVASFVLVVAPMVWTILKIDDAGAKASDISKYSTLIQTVGADVNVVKGMLAGGAKDGPKGKERKVTLIVPELVLVDQAKPLDSSSPLNINMKGIYWSPSNPLVDIDNESYYVGDKIQGYTIVKIDKTSVHFKAKDGTVVVKDFYESLFNNKK